MGGGSGVGSSVVVVVLDGSVVDVVLGGSVVVVVLGGSVVVGAVGAGDVSGGAGVVVLVGIAAGGCVVDAMFGDRVVGVTCEPGRGDGSLPPPADGPVLEPPTVVVVEVVPTPIVVPFAAFTPIWLDVPLLAPDDR